MSCTIVIDNKLNSKELLKRFIFAIEQPEALPSIFISIGKKEEYGIDISYGKYKALKVKDLRVTNLDYYDKQAYEEIFSSRLYQQVLIDKLPQFFNVSEENKDCLSTFFKKNFDTKTEIVQRDNLTINSEINLFIDDSCGVESSVLGNEDLINDIVAQARPQKINVYLRVVSAPQNDTLLNNLFGYFSKIVLANITESDIETIYHRYPITDNQMKEEMTPKKYKQFLSNSQYLRVIDQRGKTSKERFKSLPRWTPTVDYGD